MLNKKLFQYFIALFRMSRPDHLLVITLVYTWGVLMALARQAQFNSTVYFWCWLAIMLVSISVHYANEYADYETDLITTRTMYSGGSGALPDLKLPLKTAWWAMWVSAILGTVVIIVLYQTGSLNPLGLIILFFSLFFGLMYSLPPLKLAWRGWGELDNAFLGGIALPAFGYVIFFGKIDTFVLTAMLPFSLLVFVNLLATTWADRKADKIVGKYTLATRWPVQQLRWLFGSVAGLAVLLIIFAAPYPPLVLQTSLVVVPIVGWGFFTYTRQTNPFPTVLAMLVMLFAQLFSWFIVAFGLQIKL